jgi:negative regulator of flagellin synthesis FlgM
MVDNVRFGSARPVSTQPLSAAGDVARSAPPQAAAPAPAPKPLSLAAALAQLGPPFNADKVAQLRAAIANGTYAIDHHAVADAMMRFGGGQRV